MTKTFNIPGKGGTITDSILKRLDPKIQKEVMMHWFEQNYVDIHSKSFYDPEEGYLYFGDGPFEAVNILIEEFSKFVDKTHIDSIVEKLQDVEWVPIAEPFCYPVPDSTNQKKLFDSSINATKSLLNTTVSSSNNQYFLRLLFVSVITALETYLSDFLISRLIKDEILVRKFVENDNEFGKKNIRINEVYKYYETLEIKVVKHLQNIIWHNLKIVEKIYNTVFSITFSKNSLEYLLRAVSMRHDLVHRNGKSKKGIEQNISEKQIIELLEHASSLVEDIEKSWHTMEAFKDINPEDYSHRVEDSV